MSAERPTPEQTMEARQTVGGFVFAARMREHSLGAELDAINTLIAATEPPMDDEIADFAVKYYERHNLLSSATRTRDKLLSLMRDGYAYRVAAMQASIRHFFGPVKP